VGGASPDQGGAEAALQVDATQPCDNVLFDSGAILNRCTIGWEGGG
jgi:hypothetical protein